MGIGIDYSIHVITHFNSHLKKGPHLSKALEETIGISGKAIIINVISVSAGFLVSALLRNGSSAVFRIADISEYGWIRSECFDLPAGDPDLSKQEAGNNPVNIKHSMVRTIELEHYKFN